VIQALVTPACRAGRCRQPPGEPWDLDAAHRDLIQPGPGRALPGPGTRTAQNADRGIARPLARPAAGSPGQPMLGPGLPAQPVIHVAIGCQQVTTTDRNEQSVIS